MLHVIYYIYTVYELHMCMWDQNRDVYSVQRVVLEWEDLKVIWAMQFPPPSLYCALHCTQRCYCRTANCSRTGHAKRGATCTYLKACSPPHFSTPTALKQHRDQSIRPVPISDSDYSDMYQWTVIHIKWQWQWSVNHIHCTVYLVCALCTIEWSSWSQVKWFSDLVIQWFSDSVTLQWSVIQWSELVISDSVIQWH